MPEATSTQRPEGSGPKGSGPRGPKEPGPKGPERLEVDICVIGAGSGGLSVAAGAAQLGASVVLIEKGRMGGDCLNYGCVPSKALIAAGKAAQAVREAGRFGVHAIAPQVNWQDVHDHVHGVIAAIAPHDSVERFEGLGVRVIRAEARFIGPVEVAAGDVVVTARRFVIATGSSPLVPPIPGLDGVPYLTNETVFANAAPIDRLLVIGGGPIGMELAQAHHRLGARVAVLEMGRVLPMDDPELANVVATRLRREGVEIHEQARVVAVRAAGDGRIAVTAEDGAGGRELTGSHLLLAAGRRANVEGLNLEAAAIDYGPCGITVDRRLRTSNRRVFAIGDVAGGPQFTHVAGHHAGIVLRNVLFRLPAKAEQLALPWVTYTEPELAQVGLTEAEARGRHGRINVLRAPFADNDRARAERDDEGFVKLVTTPGGKLLGAGIAGPHAGELILPFVLALKQGLKAGALADLVAPYPSLSEAGKRAAGSYFIPKLFSPRTKKLVRLLARLG